MIESPAKTCCSIFLPTKWDSFLHLNKDHHGQTKKFMSLGFNKRQRRELEKYTALGPKLVAKHPTELSQIKDLQRASSEQRNIESETEPVLDENPSKNLFIPLTSTNNRFGDKSDLDLADIEDLLSDNEFNEKEGEEGSFNTAIDSVEEPDSGELTSIHNVFEKSQKEEEDLIPNFLDNDCQFTSDFMLEDNDEDGECKPFYSWANGCAYFCKACRELSFTEYTLFIKHIKNHGLNGLLAYKKRYGDPYSVQNFIECKICNEQVIHDYNKIGAHLRKRHKKYSVSTYYDTFVSIKPTVEIKLEESAYLEECFKQTSPVNCDDDEANCEEDSTFGMSASEDLDTFKNWVNQCAISCKSDGCHFMTKEIFEFKEHVLAVHDQIYEDYCDIHGLGLSAPWTKVCLLPCKLCGINLSHNYGDVDTHMKENHMISGFTYYMEQNKLV